jgi:hypothetical protein
MFGGVTVPSLTTSQAFALEFFVSFNLMFVITAVAVVSVFLHYLNSKKCKGVQNFGGGIIK